MTGLCAGLLFAEAASAASVLLPLRKPQLIVWQEAEASGAGAMPAAVMLPIRKPVFQAEPKAEPATPEVVEVREPEPAPAVSALKLKVNEGSFLITSLFERLGESDARLSEEDAARYGHIFAFQDNGEFAKADAEMGKIKDRRLMGHVYYQRYMSHDYKASFAELAEWLKRYPDHPGAQRVYDLAQRRKPDGASLTSPKQGRGISTPSMIEAALVPVSEARGSGNPVAGWKSGLASWKAGDYAAAEKNFAVAASARTASPWLSSAGAYWAARAALRARHPQNVTGWLTRAAQQPRTFYGIIALKALGLEQSRFNWTVPSLDEKRIRALSRVPAGRRALALVDSGNPQLAAAELSQISPGDDLRLQEAMVALAAKAGLPDLALRMGSAFHDEEGNLYDAALYPDAPWQPDSGFKVDRALVYAFIRQESKFDADASNRSSGASGLMQLMPATAAHVARQSGETVDKSDLKDPTINITLGQQYLSSLLQDPSVGNNLFKLAVAYNAGPGKLARWEKQVRYEDDPLLFVESIPAAETRDFVERVMTNFWIYRLKYGQRTETLDHVAEGEWPVYTAQDIRRGKSLAAAVGTVFTR